MATTQKRTWRRPLNIEFVLWIFCTVLIGAFIEGDGVYVVITFLAASLAFWVTAFFLIGSHPVPSIVASILLVVGPFLVFLATVLGWIIFWSR